MNDRARVPAMGSAVTAGAQWLRPNRRFLLALAAVVILPRAVWVSLMATVPSSDFLCYDTQAMRLAQGMGYCTPHGLPTAYWPPAYPLLLSIAYSVFGHAYDPVYVANIGLHLISCVLLWRIGATISENVGRAAALLYALWPSFIGQADLLASENLFVPLLLAAVLAVMEAERAGKAGLYWLGGLAAGLSALTRGLSLLLPVVFGLYVLAARRRLGPAVVATALSLLGVMVAVGPWVVRNQLILGRACVGTNTGENLWKGNNPLATGTFQTISLDPRADRVWHSSLKEAERDRRMSRLAMQYIRSHPGRWLALAPHKLFWLWSRDTWSVGWTQFSAPRPRSLMRLRLPLAIIAQGYYVACLFLAAWYVVVTLVRRQWRPIHTLAVLMVAYWCAVHVMWFGMDRYHAPVLPFVAVLAAAALMPALGRLRLVQDA
jgi:4-amino-4-deoxy-L-arabinose transferase-like glycosyltransferase